jgi:hypothetical protein
MRYAHKHRSAGCQKHLTLSTLWQTYSYPIIVNSAKPIIYTTHLEVPLNIAQQRNIEDGSRNEQNKRPRKDQNRRNHREQQHGGDGRVIPVCRDVGSLEAVRVDEGVQDEGVDGLTGTVGEE